MFAEARVFWNSFVVLSSKNSRCQRGPDGGAVAMLRKESPVVLLEIISPHEGVLGLLDDGLVQVQSCAEFDCRGDEVGFPF